MCTDNSKQILEIGARLKTIKPIPTISPRDHVCVVIRALSLELNILMSSPSFPQLSPFPHKHTSKCHHKPHRNPPKTPRLHQKWRSSSELPESSAASKAWSTITSSLHQRARSTTTTSARSRTSNQFYSYVPRSPIIQSLFPLQSQCSNPSSERKVQKQLTPPT